MTTAPESFCLLLWIHAQRQRKLCCIDETSLWGSRLAVDPRLDNPLR